MEEWSVWVQFLGTIILAATLIFVVIQTRNLSKQTKSLEQSIIGNTIWQITMNHRELLSKVFEFPFLGKTLRPDQPDDEIKKACFLSMLINNAESIYEQSRLGNISENYWKPIAKDMVNMFTNPEVRARWEEVKVFHSKEFQDFVEEETAHFRK